MWAIDRAVTCMHFMRIMHAFHDDPFHLRTGCGHCKRLAPIYDEVGEAFASEGSVLIAKVDADAEKALGNRFGIRGFPTLKFFPRGSTEPEE